MVRPINVARSRACNQCKKKRIKCDLSSPACQRCILSNLPCSGPLSGLFMVNADPSTYASVTSEEPPIRRSALVLSASASASAPAPYNILYRSPSPVSTYEDALLSSFLGAFFSKSASRLWDGKLPYLKSAGNAAAMKAAAKAVSLAFAANSLNDPAVAASACESYGQCLRYHQRSFATDDDQKICHKNAVHALPVTVLLSYFETVQPTSADAWIRHLAAAERLFLLVGPNALQDDLLNHLYLIVKSSSVTRCFLTRSRTQLFRPPWSNIHATHVRGCLTLQYNRMMEFMACLCDHFATTDPPKSGLSILEKLAELTELCIAFEDNIELGESGFPWLKSHPGSKTIQAPLLLQSEQDIPGIPTPIRDPKVCLTAAWLHTGALLLFTLLQRTTSREWSQNNITITRTYHSTQILSCAKHLATQGGFYSPRMTLPIATVDRHSPVQQHKVLARTIFTRWCTSTGLSGFCSAAFDKDPIDKTKPFVMPVRDILNQEPAWKLDDTVRGNVQYQPSPDSRWHVRRCDVCGA